jgi:threonine synthase
MTRAGERFVCTGCGVVSDADPRLWRCEECGAPVDFAREPARLSPADLQAEGISRYASWLGFEKLISLGEPRTPLFQPARPAGVEVKCEAALPTGSFKDRGAATLIAWLAARGVSEVVLDSSGNAACAIAAYAARAGVRCEVHVPASASAIKVRQAAWYGAKVITHHGPRYASSAAAQEVSERRGLVYASQLWHPAFLLGVETLAFELWEQRRTPPDSIVIPVGAGTLLLGIARGFDRLRASGLVERTPRLIGVQTDSCAPIASRFRPVSVPSLPTTSIAEGIQVQDPPRADEIIDTIKRSAGVALAVDELAVRSAFEDLAHGGLLVEPTSAAAFAGLDRARAQGIISRGENVVVVSTGSGLKAPTEPLRAAVRNRNTDPDPIGSEHDA